MKETQKTISKWANETFGKPKSTLSVAIRALAEHVELLQKLIIDDQHPGAAEEAVDVIIVLQRIGTMLNKDLEKEKNRKMAINRKRRWTKDGNGHGHHV